MYRSGKEVGSSSPADHKSHTALGEKVSPQGEPDLKVITKRELHYASVALRRDEFAEADRGTRRVLRVVTDAGFGERAGEDGGVRHVEHFPLEAEFVIFTPRHRELLLKPHVHHEVRRHPQLV